MKEVTIYMEKVDSDQYFCKGKRLSFDLPWTIYRVNNDLYRPYYRIYIGDCLMTLMLTEASAYDYIKDVSVGEAKIAEL